MPEEEQQGILSHCQESACGGHSLVVPVVPVPVPVVPVGGGGECGLPVYC